MQKYLLTSLYIEIISNKSTLTHVGTVAPKLHKQNRTNLKFCCFSIMWYDQWFLYYFYCPFLYIQKLACLWIKYILSYTALACRLGIWSPREHCELCQIDKFRHWKNKQTNSLFSIKKNQPLSVFTIVFACRRSQMETCQGVSTIATTQSRLQATSSVPDLLLLHKDLCNLMNDLRVPATARVTWQKAQVPLFPIWCHSCSIDQE
jgi:hypothetical protein